MCCKTRFCRLQDWTSCFDHLLVSETEHLTLDWDDPSSSSAFSPENIFASDSLFAIFPVLLRSFAKASKTLLASVKVGSEIMENGLLCGGAKKTINGGSYGFRGWTLIICSIFLPRWCVKAQTNIQLFFQHFLYWFWICGATRTSKPFCNIKVNIIVVVT